MFYFTITTQNVNNNYPCNESFHPNTIIIFDVSLKKFANLNIFEREKLLYMYNVNNFRSNSSEKGSNYTRRS